MNEHDYEVDVRPLSESDGGGFIAIVPELPGCMADGDTPAQALENAYDAARCWIQEARRMDKVIPRAQYAAHAA